MVYRNPSLRSFCTALRKQRHDLVLHIRFNALEMPQQVVRQVAKYIRHCIKSFYLYVDDVIGKQRFQSFGLAKIQISSVVPWYVPWLRRQFRGEMYST